MQLSTSQSSSETNLAALMLGGICPAGQAGGMTSTAAVPGGLDFSQLLPETGAETPVGPQPAADTVWFKPGAAPSLPLGEANVAVVSDDPLSMQASSPLPVEQASDQAPIAIEGRRLTGEGRQRGKARAGAADAVPAEVQKPGRKSAASAAERPLAILPEGMMPLPPTPAPTELLSFEFELPETNGVEQRTTQESGMVVPFASSSELPGQPRLNPTGATISKPTWQNAVSPAAFSPVEPMAADAVTQDSRKSDRAIADTLPHDDAAAELFTFGARPEVARPMPRFSFRPEPSDRVGEMSPLQPTSSVAEAEDMASVGFTLSPEKLSKPEVPVPVAVLPATAAMARASVPVSDTANIAVRPEKSRTENDEAISASGKSFLNASGKRVTSYRTNLGIGVAKTVPAMSSAILASHTPSPTSVADVSVAFGVESGKSIPDFAAPADALASTAHRAVEEVLHVAERVLARDQSSVNIQFSIGGEDLSVRVEMRANEVHATFRTDSPELRAALSQEWQNVANQGGDRSLRSVTPVFTASDSSAFSSSSGDTASQQHRDSGAQRAGHEFMPALPARAASTSPTAPTAAVPTPRVWSRNSLHLHTLA